MKKALTCILLGGLPLSSTPVLGIKGPRYLRIFDLLSQVTNDMELVTKRVETQMKGKVFHARLVRGDKDSHVFEVSALVEDKGVLVIVDPKSGQIINASDEGFWESWSNRNAKKAALRANIPMSQAVSTAQKACDGKAARAMLIEEREMILYEIETLTQTGRCVVLVDSETGEHYKLPTKGEEHHKKE